MSIHVILMGPQGSGKGTQSELVRNRLRLESHRHWGAVSLGHQGADGARASGFRPSTTAASWSLTI